jgi:hypothetical protein
LLCTNARTLCAQIQAKISRLYYLGDTDKARALETAAAEAAAAASGGGGKGKKAPKGGSDPEAEAEALALAAKLARRAELQAAGEGKEPWVRPCPPNGAVLLTDEKRSRVDADRAAKLAASAEAVAVRDQTVTTTITTTKSRCDCRCDCGCGFGCAALVCLLAS